MPWVLCDLVPQLGIEPLPSAVTLDSQGIPLFYCLMYQLQMISLLVNAENWKGSSNGVIKSGALEPDFLSLYPGSFYGLCTLGWITQPLCVSVLSIY